MSEHDLQCSFIDWCEWQGYGDIVFAIPNAARRSFGLARRLKKEGLRAGVPDVFFAMASSDYNGLFIEFKWGRNKQTAAQLKWQRSLEEAGYKVVVCKDLESAINAVNMYLV